MASQTDMNLWYVVELEVIDKDEKTKAWFCCIQIGVILSIHLNHRTTPWSEVLFCCIFNRIEISDHKIRQNSKDKSREWLEFLIISNILLYWLICFHHFENFVCTTINTSPKWCLNLIIFAYKCLTKLQYWALPLVQNSLVDFGRSVFGATQIRLCCYFLNRSSCECNNQICHYFFVIWRFLNGRRQLWIKFN